MSFCVIYGAVKTHLLKDNHSFFELLDSIFLSLEAEIDYFIWIETCMLEKKRYYTGLVAQGLKCWR